MIEPQETVDTKHLQMKSLIRFADELGYDFYTPAVWNTFVRRNREGFKGCEYIRFNTMVELYNKEWVESSHKEGYLFPYPGGCHTFTIGNPLKLDSNSPFHVDVDTLAYAQASKLVEQLYLNGGRKGIKCYRNQIKFTNPTYYDLFLVPLIKEQTK